MEGKKKYIKPEVKSIELSFNAAQMGTCHTPSVPTLQSVFPPVPCTIAPCP